MAGVDSNVFWQITRRPGKYPPGSGRETPDLVQKQFQMWKQTHPNPRGYTQH